MKILTVVGARPQFIKASVVSRAISQTPGLREAVIHTGQHFDTNMSAVFFDQLNIPRPAHQLDIHGGGHGEMTGRMLAAIEPIVLQERPDYMLVYGDTNSTLAGALCAAKLHVPLAHVEAGMRSFDMRMPEEVNRVLADHVSTLLLCPTEASVRNLHAEGLGRRARISLVGDVMQDAALFFASHAERMNDDCRVRGFVLATVHRAENTDDPDRLASIVGALNAIHTSIAPVLLPLHPRTRQAIRKAGLRLDVEVIEPVGYLHMVAFLRRAGLVITDSGGLQKEAFFFGKACVTLRDRTEWVELVERGVNELVGADASAIIAGAKRQFGRTVEDDAQLYGGGRAATRVVHELLAGTETGAP